MTFNRDQVTSAPGSWVYDPSRTIQEKLVRWSYYVIMRQRGISYEVLGAELGVARARVQQLLWAAATSERSQLRLDAAISSITQRQHDATCDCDDPSCVVFTVTTPDNRLHQAEMGAINDWRDRINPNPEDEEEAA